MAFDTRPMYIQAALNYGLWSGDVAPTQYQGPINITKLELTAIQQENDRLISNIDGSFGEALASVPKPTDPGTVSMEFNSMPKDLLALVIGADQTALTQTNDTVTDEAITTVLNIWVPLANKFLDSATPLVLETDGAPDVVIPATNYTVDYISGMIMATNVAAVGTGLLATYKKLALTASETYAAGKAKSAYLKLIGPATEKISGKRGLLIVHKMSVSNSAAYDWVKGGYATGTLAGDLLTPSTETSPYTFHYAMA